MDMLCHLCGATGIFDLMMDLLKWKTLMIWMICMMRAHFKALHNNLKFDWSHIHCCGFIYSLITQEMFKEYFQSSIMPFVQWN